MARAAACHRRGRSRPSPGGGHPPDNGVTEQLIDGVFGLFAPYQDPPAVAAKLQGLLPDSTLRQRLGAAFRQTVEAHYSATILTRGWERLLNQIMAEDRARGRTTRSPSRMELTSGRAGAITARQFLSAYRQLSGGI